MEKHIRIRIFSILVLMITSAVILTGCWNYREVNNLSIVAGMAIDKAEQNRYMLTIEIVDMHEGGREAKIKSKLLVTYGNSIYDAIRNALDITAPILYWGHAQVVIISKEVAKEGISEILDGLSRNPEPRLSIKLAVSEENTAKEILESKSITTEIRSYEINDMMNSQKSVSKSVRVEIYQFISMLAEEGISPVLPALRVIENEGSRKSELSGMAFFNGDKLAGFLGDDETKAYLFIMNKIKDGPLIIKKETECGNAKMSLEINNNKTNLKPVYSDGKLSMLINVVANTYIREHGTRENFINEKGSKVLEEASAKDIREHMTGVIKKMQDNYDLDIFGFGNTVKKDMPDLWKKIKNNWSKIFRDLNVNVNVTIDIQNSGFLSKPIKNED